MTIVLGELVARVKYNWKLMAALAAPIALSPIAWAIRADMSSPNGNVEEDTNKKFRALYCIVLMAVYWLFEVVPLAITALLPLVIFPLMNVQDSASISKNYMKESNMIFLGAIIIALSIEYCGLHVRCALRVINIFGTHASRIMLATMIIAAVTSMWVSATSTTTMLLPILSAITDAMFREEQYEATAMEGHHADEITSLGSNTAYKRHRRESTVFTNSSMESSMRQKSRKLSHLSGKVSAVNSTAATGTLTRKETRAVTADGRRESRVSVAESMSVIMEQDSEIKDVLSSTPISNQVSDSKHIHLESVESQIAREKHQRSIKKMLLFSVAYATCIGGTGSLVGTGPIKVFKELIKEYKLEKDKNMIGITFATWMGFNGPPILINIIIVWLYLNLRYIGAKEFCIPTKHTPAEKQQVKAHLKEEYEKLGPVTAHEIGVGTIFFCVVLLWIFRDPQIFPGWKSLIHANDTGDSTPAILGCVLLFVLPRDWSFLSGTEYTRKGKYEALLDWKFVSTNAPWSYVLLIGSGYAIADASQQSGLSVFFADVLKKSEDIPLSALLLIVMLITCFLTQVLSNTACASLILPALFSLSCGSKIHPIYLTMASAITSSYAFMFPISSPPNAIIFATGELTIREMFFNGAWLTIICLFVLYVAIVTYGDFIFHFSRFHDDANLFPIYNFCNATKCVPE